MRNSWYFLDLLAALFLLAWQPCSSMLGLLAGASGCDHVVCGVLGILEIRWMWNGAGEFVRCGC
jgi:hypothetical protein